MAKGALKWDVSMKSGLEDRNNRYCCGVVDGAADVSMKSGLEDRNNCMGMRIAGW